MPDELVTALAEPLVDHHVHGCLAGPVTRLGFEIDHPTWEAARSEAAGLERLSAERVRDEWFRSLETTRSLRRLVALWREVGAVERSDFAVVAEAAIAATSATSAAPASTALRPKRFMTLLPRDT